MSQMENFIFCADNLVEYFADIKEIHTGSLTLMSLQARKTELADLWSEVKSAYADCVRSKLEQLSEENLTAVKSKYKLSTETYISCLEFILTASNKLNPSNSDPKSLDVQENSASCDSQTKPPASQQNSSFNNAFSLPACDSEVFHGDYLSWPSFRDMFSAVYINHDRLSPVQKLFHLRAKTRGDAFNLVSKFALTGTNFELAWKALSDQYENKRILVNSQLKILMNLPNITVETDKALKHLHRDVSNCLSALQTYGINTDSWDSFLTFLVSIRLPEKTLSLWEQDLKEPSEVPTWKNMSEFLAAR